MPGTYSMAKKQDEVKNPRPGLPMLLLRSQRSAWKHLQRSWIKQLKKEEDRKRFLDNDMKTKIKG